MSSHKPNKKQTGCSKLVPLFHNNFIPVKSLLEIVTVIVQEACSRVTLLDIDRTVILQESGIELHLVHDLIFQLHTSWSNSAVWENVVKSDICLNLNFCFPLLQGNSCIRNVPFEKPWKPTKKWTTKSLKKTPTPHVGILVNVFDFK